MKGVFVILDGVADEPTHVLGDKTPLEKANTPNLDFFASRGAVGHCYPLGVGKIPESSSAIVSLFGQNPIDCPRGSLEALGAGVDLKRGDLALRCNFATLEDMDSRNLLDRRAGRTLTTKEAKTLAKAINENVKLPFKFKFYSTIQHRGVLVFKGGFSDNISNTDPAYGDGVAMNKHDNKLKISKPFDDEEDSQVAAELLNKFTRRSHEVLDNHELNLIRAKKGFFSANCLICRDAGNFVPKLKKLKGDWMAMAYMPLEKGIARALKMKLFSFKYPVLKGIDVYDNLYSGLKKAVRTSIKMVKRYNKKYDYFYIHIKETDLPGHDNKPFDKVKMIEYLDKNLFGYLKRFSGQDFRLLVTGDHTTSCKRKSHTADPVPVMFFDSKKEVIGKRFVESDGVSGKRFASKSLLDRTLFS